MIKQESDCQCNPEVCSGLYAYQAPTNNPTSNSKTTTDGQDVSGKDLHFLTNRPLESLRINNTKLICTEPSSDLGIQWSASPYRNQNSLSSYRYGISKYGLFCPIPGQDEEKITMNMNTIRSSKAYELAGNAILTHTSQSKNNQKFERSFIIPKPVQAKNCNILSSLERCIKQETVEELKIEKFSDSSSIAIDNTFVAKESNYKIDSLFPTSLLSSDSKSNYTSREDVSIKVDLAPFKSMSFESVKDIRQKVDEMFAPQNIKMICKRAERVYSNSYRVFVLYCHKCK